MCFSYLEYLKWVTISYVLRLGAGPTQTRSFLNKRRAQTNRMRHDEMLRVGRIFLLSSHRTNIVRSIMKRRHCHDHTGCDIFYDLGWRSSDLPIVRFNCVKPTIRRNGIKCRSGKLCAWLERPSIDCSQPTQVTLNWKTWRAWKVPLISSWSPRWIKEEPCSALHWFRYRFVLIGGLNYHLSKFKESNRRKKNEQEPWSVRA